MSQKKKKGGKPKFETTRKMYEAVRKYDRQAFDSFCSSVFETGYDAGRASEDQKKKPAEFDFNYFFRELEEIKGLGEKKLDAIKAAVNRTQEHTAKEGNDHDRAENERN